MSSLMMKCGHSSNAEHLLDDGTRIPCCAICSCDMVIEPPDLTGRVSRCSYFGQTFRHNGRQVTCKGESQSSLKLPFFAHKPKEKFDEHYCGCFGWD